MALEKFRLEDLRSYLKRHKIATLRELKNALGTSGTMTVFRKLKAVGYRSSYSHRGKYYTLLEIPAYDAVGLWSYRSVWFSQHGNLVETVRKFVEEAEAGFTLGELQRSLHVDCKRAVLQLCRQGRLRREQREGVYVYLAADREKRRSQVRVRSDGALPAGLGVSRQTEAPSHEVKAAILLFASLLDEKQRRLYAGLESCKFGHGGDRKIADLLGVNEHTVARGRRELFRGEIEPERVRREGGGRKRVEKKRPES